MTSTPFSIALLAAGVAVGFAGVGIAPAVAQGDGAQTWTIPVRSRDSARAAQDRTALGFDQYIRDAAQLEDVSSGQRWNGSWLDASAIAQSNPAKYRIVPLSELQP